MRINIFGLNKKDENWKEVKHALYQTWIGNQSGAMFPMWCDYDFQKAFNKIKREKTLKECQEVLGL